MRQGYYDPILQVRKWRLREEMQLALVTQLRNGKVRTQTQTAWP